MPTATATKRVRRKPGAVRGRPPIDRGGAPKPEVIAGQITGREIEYVREKIVKPRGFSESHVVRRALQLLIVQDLAGKIDWGTSLDLPEAAGGINDETKRRGR